MGARTSTDRRRAVWAWATGIACLLLAQYAVRKYYRPEFFVFDPLSIFLFIGLWGVVYAGVLITAIRTWGPGTRRALWWPVVFLVATIGILLFFSSRWQERSSAPVLFDAYYDGDINGVGLRLRSDGTYEAVDGATIGGDILYGDYRLMGDTIMLGREHFRLGDAHWRFGNILLITDTGVVQAPAYRGQDRYPFVMRITQDDRPFLPVR